MFLFKNSNEHGSDEYLLLQGDESNPLKKNYKKWWRKIPTKFLSYCSCVLVLVGIILIAVLYAFNNSYNSRNIRATSSVPQPIYERLFGKFNRAAVVTNAVPCAIIGKNILLMGGNAVDAMIASMICDGVGVPQSMGIGGGFFMVIYKKIDNTYVTINARETAPAAATIDMFKNSNQSQFGAISVAIPGEVKGYWTAYKQFGGGVPWKELFEPTIVLCEMGFPIDKNLANVLTKMEEFIKKTEGFRQIFLNPNTGQLLEAGDTYRNLKLAQTLRTIAERGGDAFYEESIAASLSQDIREAGGIITEQDLKDYKVIVEKPLVAKLSKYKVHTLQPPSSGLVLAYILRIIDSLLPASSELLNTQRTTEAFKYAYAVRADMGDARYVNISSVLERVLSDEFIQQVRAELRDNKTWNDPAHYRIDSVGPNDHGTANLAVLSENGDAVVATSTINLRFGSRLISKSTGIILNDEMDDFSTPNVTNYFGLPPTKANFISPGKRPMSSMCPAIITDKNENVILLIGAAGGSAITTSVAIAASRVLYMKEGIRTAIDNVLFHHQLTPMTWLYYRQIAPEIIEGMNNIGHEVKEITSSSFCAVTAIQKGENNIYGACDRKRPGQVDGY